MTAILIITIVLLMIHGLIQDLRILQLKKQIKIAGMLVKKLESTVDKKKFINCIVELAKDFEGQDDMDKG
jgi:hypothetical protein